MATPLEIFDTAVVEGKATWWQMILPSGNVIFGDAKTDMLGYQASQFSTYQDFTALLHPDDYEAAMSAMKDHIDGKTPFYSTIYRIKHQSGHYIRFYDCGQMITNQNGEIEIMGFVWKVEDDSPIEQQVEEIKRLVLDGNPSMIDLIGLMK